MDAGPQAKPCLELRVRSIVALLAARTAASALRLGGFAFRSSTLLSRRHSDETGRRAASLRDFELVLKPFHLSFDILDGSAQSIKLPASVGIPSLSQGTSLAVVSNVSPPK